MEDPSLEIPQLVRLSAAAARLGASRETVRYWIRMGRIRSIKLGRGLYLRTDDIQTLIREGEVNKAHRPRGVQGF
jgi:excisionase family DNA binding protein